ncbi:MAG TPA: S8 family serine peptidase [Cyclobacteriaceae bacterium]|nr:S8 family serine peptidase [Cyclobacteriaceae bacterium]
MKRILVFVSLFCLAAVCAAQTNSIPSDPAAYHPGTLLAKIKPAYRYLAQSTIAGRSTSLPDIIIEPIANPTATKQNRLARGPLSDSQFAIDMSLYVRLNMDPGTNLRTRINELLATGYFEIIEPDYVANFSFTPNDALLGQQNYLTIIKAFEAWDVSQSDTGTVIAVIDSGGDLDHPDLAANIYVNPDEIPSNGIDDDHDGYIDNINGWDFMGADTLNLYNSSFVGDNDPNLKQTGDAGALSHGVWVAGCAAAVGNNGTGIAGVGFKSKILFTKHSADNQKSSSIYRGYSGILYAAQTLKQDNVSRAIINCSWGGSFRSQIAQDIITHVTVDLGYLVVCAAGNAGSNTPSYPAAYDNALSVGATDSNDIKASFSNYGGTVDISAPGVSIYTTAYNNGFNSISGTSFSSPITAGAAAVVWSKFPTFTPLQVAEQLRATADNVDALSPAIFNQLMGHGRLNVKNAVTQSVPSIRISKPTMLDNLGNTAEPGKEAFLTASFTNFLKTSGPLTVTATSNSGLITFTKNEIQMDAVAAGATVRNTLNPFRALISASTPDNTTVDIKLSYTDGTYTDNQIIQVQLNPSFFNLDRNTITTSIASTGRIGYDDPDKETIGIGFVVDDTPILFEMGLIMGTSVSNIYNNVRGTGSTFEQDFAKVASIKRSIPGVRAAQEVFGSFAPTASPSLVIGYRGLALKDKPNDKFVIMEYSLTNNSTAPISNFRLGLFADWDISVNGATDAANWDAAHKIAYVYPKQSQSLPHAGIQVLNTTGSVYSIDNDQTIANNPFGLYDGFTKDEKFTSLSTVRNVAGSATNGNDVSQVVSVSPFTIPAGGTVVLAFALHAANNLSELLASADAANTLYNQTFTAPQPTVSVSETCFGSKATLTATGPTPSSKFRWYRTVTDGHPFDSLSSTITTANLTKDTIIYVSNADQVYESVRTAVQVKLKANPTITATSAGYCPGKAVTLSVGTADSYLWSTGATTQSIDVSVAGNYAVTVQYNALSCTKVSAPVAVTALPSPTPSFSSTGDLVAGSSIFFNDLSTNALSWSWDFGDGAKATTKAPAHTYATADSYTVSLTIVGGNGCAGTTTKKLAVITGLEPQSQTSWLIYPSPATDYLNIRMPQEVQYAQVLIMTTQGQQAIQAQINQDGSGSRIFVGGLSEGMYVVRIQDEHHNYAQKILIHR